MFFYVHQEVFNHLLCDVSGKTERNISGGSIGKTDAKNFGTPVSGKKQQLEEQVKVVES